MLYYFEKNYTSNHYRIRSISFHFIRIRCVHFSQLMCECDNADKCALAKTTSSELTSSQFPSKWSVSRSASQSGMLPGQHFLLRNNKGILPILSYSDNYNYSAVTLYVASVIDTSLIAFCIDYFTENNSSSNSLYIKYLKQSQLCYFHSQIKVIRCQQLCLERLIFYPVERSSCSALMAYGYVGK